MVVARRQNRRFAFAAEPRIFSCCSFVVVLAILQVIASDVTVLAISSDRSPSRSRNPPYLKFQRATLSLANHRIFSNFSNLASPSAEIPPSERSPSQSSATSAANSDIDAATPLTSDVGIKLLSCDKDLHGVGSLNTTCTVNTSVILQSGAALIGTGSLVLLPNASIACNAPDGSLALVLGSSVVMNPGSTISACTVTLNAGTLTMAQDSAILAVGLASKAPDQTSGTPTDGKGSGGGYGGRGASCTSVNDMWMTRNQMRWNDPTDDGPASTTRDHTQNSTATPDSDEEQRNGMEETGDKHTFSGMESRSWTDMEKETGTVGESNIAAETWTGTVTGVEPGEGSDSPGSEEDPEAWGGDAYAWSTLTEPWKTGSRGGGSGAMSEGGGLGGGRIRVSVRQLLLDGGRMSADGGEARSGQTGPLGGGGSGGSVIVASQIM